MYTDTNGPDDVHGSACTCNKKNTVVLDVRSLSWFVSLMILLSFFIFISGYFLGKKAAVDDMADVLIHDSLSDRVYASMCSLYGYKGDKGENQLSELSSEQQGNTEIDILEAEDEQDPDPATDPEQNSVPQEKFYAQLAGFGTARAAEKFASKLKNKGTEAKVNKRRSKTSKGKLVSWYQVVTAPYDNKDQLEALVLRLQKEEKLHDIRVVTC